MKKILLITSTSLLALLLLMGAYYHINKPSLESVIMQNWTYIAGEKRAPRCSPQRISGGDKLIVIVTSATLKQELEFEKRSILYRLTRIPECSGIKQVRIVMT